MKVTVTHSGKQHAYQHAYSLEKLGRLERLITSTYYRPSRWPDKLASLSPRLHRPLQKRGHPRLDDRLVVRHIGLEMPELWYRNILKARERAETAMFRRDERFDRWVAEKYASKAQVLWGFQGSCLESLRAVRQAGGIAVCEFATAHVTAAIRILNQEAEKHPEWAGTISNFHFPDWYQERLEGEPAAADWCIAASGFTRDSLVEVGVSQDRIQILPLAADIDQFEFAPRSDSGPLKVLFVGGIGQRKGMKYLFQAMEQLDSAEVQLSLLGPLPPDETALKSNQHLFEYLGRTDQAGVAEVMKQHDVLVLPSVFEGFGLVIVEAMATGMPVIASTHSCGPEVIREGVDGFVLAPDDVAGLAEKMNYLAANKKSLPEMGRNAFERSKEFSWRQHRDRLAVVLNEMGLSAAVGS